MSSSAHGRTDRLELSDSALREWQAVVVAASLDDGIVLDRSESKGKGFRRIRIALPA
ncbi:MAG: hypothetical protein PSX37_06105 [bacterium]|nr:hypothetical protein [bacterium]